MPMSYTPFARRMGLLSALAVVALLLAYGATLAYGLATLPSPDQPIAQPMLAILEILILLMMPVIMMLAIAIHAWVADSFKTASLMGVLSMSIVATITTIVHALVLALSGHPAFLGEPWTPWVLSFRWPSVVYVLDIVAWDWFFGWSMLLLGVGLRGNGLARLTRLTMVTSAVLSFAGLSGAFTGNMQLRNIGIVGYVGVFLIASAMLAALFYRTKPVQAP